MGDANQEPGPAPAPAPAPVPVPELDEGRDVGRDEGHVGGRDGASAYAVISDTPINTAAIEAFVMASDMGALVTFRGIVRDHDHGLSVTALDYSAHPDAQRFLEECCSTIAAESGLHVAAAHRVGSLVVGDVALVASVAAAHRGEAFAACEKLVDLIKTNVPIWKRQHLADGVTEWVGL